MRKIEKGDGKKNNPNDERIKYFEKRERNIIVLCIWVKKERNTNCFKGWGRQIPGNK